MPQFSRSHDRGGGNANSSGGGVNKKKFGKNLNKLVKPAAPPIPNDKSDRNARNGLLLLSTKKPTSGLLASKTNATISTNGGANVAPNKSSISLNLQSQPNPSTHQVLLSAVVGASHPESEQKLDAWGVADQVKEQQLNYDDSPPMDEEKSNLERGWISEENPDHYYEEHDYENQEMLESRDGPHYDAGASWDEYGGRGDGAKGNGVLVETDDQGTYMARLARERAQAKSQEEESRFAEQKARAALRLKELEQKKASKAEDSPRTNGTRTLWEPENKNGTNGNKNGTNGKHVKDSSKGANAKPADAEQEPMIHLSSYEDRDRGERGSGAAPRMLYDPKSGAMVEVKARTENSNACGKPRKDRRSKAKKERETPEIVTKNGRNKQKGRKDTAGNGHEKKKANPNRRTPRTCGVLYRRDGKGHLRSMDDCDGDLGYGAHSVPGGRVRNPDAFAAWSEQNQHPGVDEAHNGTFEFVPNPTNGVVLETGFTIEEPQPVMEWVKADEKIELITGVDDSPTLKPTAKAFAPSEAALAAAAAAATAAKESQDDASSSLVDVSRGQEETEDEEDSDEPDGGLGFDPLSGIDFMSSPNGKTPEEIATVDLPALTLDPPMFSGKEGADEPGISRPLFAFGSSGTWSNGQATANGLSGWGAGSGVGLFGADVFRKGDKESEPPQFLSTSASGSWGPSSVPGLERLPAVNATEHAAGPAD